MAHTSTTPKTPTYVVEEPTTGLYAVFSPHSVRLSYQPHATRFPSVSAARIAIADQIGDQPHEIVRVSA